MRSMIVAMPMPPPMHIVTSAVVLFGRSSSSSSGAHQHGAGRAERMTERDRAAVDVDPRRIDAESRITLSGTAANASLISQRSMSLTVIPACLQRILAGRHRRGQHDHRLGAVVAVARMRARGFIPWALAYSGEASSTAAGAVDDSARVAGAYGRG